MPGSEVEDAPDAVIADAPMTDAPGDGTDMEPQPDVEEQSVDEPSEIPDTTATTSGGGAAGGGGHESMTAASKSVAAVDADSESTDAPSGGVMLNGVRFATAGDLQTGFVGPIPPASRLFVRVCPPPLVLHLSCGCFFSLTHMKIHSFCATRLLTDILSLRV